MPSVPTARMAASRRCAAGQIAVGDTLVVFPHEICPVDGTVVEGHGVMDESYLTGEPYRMSKTPGTTVLSGAINGDTASTIRADKLAVDSRYAKIMQVMRDSEQRRPRLRRLGDQLGAFYTPLAVAIALAAWALERRCRALSRRARRRHALPAADRHSRGDHRLDLAGRTARHHHQGPRSAGKGGDLPHRHLRQDRHADLWSAQAHRAAYRAPVSTEHEVLTLVASLERYSKHPLSGAVLDAASEAGITFKDATEVSERPGEGLRGVVTGRTILVTSRKKLAAHYPEAASAVPAASRRPGVRDRDRRPLRRDPSFSRRAADRGSLIHPASAAQAPFRPSAACFRRPRNGSALSGGPGRHQGGLRRTRAPSRKLELVRQETKRANTLFLGDGINDAPALTAATVGIAFGQNSDITAEAAGAVIMESSLAKVDEFLHISRRMRWIALQSAVGGMALSLLGMLVAAAGYLPPEETMTPYAPASLAADWEFKIIRSPIFKQFGNQEFRDRVLAEEERAGWMLVEVFDNARIRLKRRRPSRQRRPRDMTRTVPRFRTLRCPSPRLRRRWAACSSLAWPWARSWPRSMPQAYCVRWSRRAPNGVAADRGPSRRLLVHSVHRRPRRLNASFLIAAK